MRKLLRPAVLVTGLLGASALVPLAISQAAAVENTRTYRYGSHARQALDAYWNSPGKGTQPGIVIVHGGFWNAGRRGEWKSTAEWYAQRGFAVFTVDHRYNTDATWPAPRDDLYRAITWIKDHSGTFRLDRDRLAVIGAQAGGHLATQAGTHATGAARVRAVVGLSAITSPDRAYDTAQTTAASATRRKMRDQSVILADCTPLDGERHCLTRFRNMDSATHASAGDSPMLLVHSSHDVIPAAHGNLLKEALADAGVRDVTVRTVGGSASGGGLLSDSGLRTQILTWIRARTQARAASATTDAPPTEDASVRTERVPSRTSDDDGTTVSTPKTAAAQRERTYSYGPHPRHRLTAYYVKRSTKQPAVVLVHGGYWYEGDKSSFTDFARHLVRKGYAVFAVNYRLNTQAGWQAQRQDLYQATQWVKSHAAAFSANPRRVVLVGSSAGGHLATNLGVHSTGTRYAKAVAAVSPVANPYRAYQEGQERGATVYHRKLRDAAVLLARCTPDRDDAACWSRWIDMVSFQHAGRGDTPMLLIHSRHDFVPPAHGAQLCQALRAGSVGCAQHVVAGDEHGMGLLARPAVRDRLVKWIKAHD